MTRPRIEVNLQELDQVLEEARQAPLSEDDYQKLKTALHALAEWARSRSTEKTKAVLGETEDRSKADADTPGLSGAPGDKPAGASPGHGRNGAEAFRGAKRVEIAHPKLKHGDRCPGCGQGNVYRQKEARTLVRIVGQAPLEATRYDLERLRCNACGEVYTAEAPEGVGPERLRFHQEHSGPVMQELHRWLEVQLAEHQTEPNSGLGKAITYLLRHWNGLTAFLREPRAPLDNNLCERALKRAVLHRKNALFYRTLNGAQVGDLYMSLIHTCQLCGANSFDYLSELQRHAEELASQPAAWMPWNYRQTLQRTAAR